MDKLLNLLFQDCDACLHLNLNRKRFGLVCLDDPRRSGSLILAMNGVEGRRVLA